jgi:hypothetical protein
MKTYLNKIDFKSFIFGFLFCVTVSVLISANGEQTNSSSGRYQISVGNECWVIDTKTGAVAKISYDTSGTVVQQALKP